MQVTIAITHIAAASPPNALPSARRAVAKPNGTASEHKNSEKQRNKKTRAGRLQCRAIISAGSITQ